MAISPTGLRIPYISEAFPTGTTPNISGELIVSWGEIIWAALTIGRPSTHHVLRHGASSRYEAIFRISLVRMALEQFGPRAKRLRRTDAFKRFDPTEKGAVTYFLGMAFCKLFASRLLKTPWLLHLDIHKSTYSASYLGRSRPDLFGQQTNTGAWHSFETKGRSSKPSSTDRSNAKAQASRLVSVGGTPCTLHVGAFTYFSGDVLRFHWIDPPTDKENPISVADISDGWDYYYGPTWSLWGGDSTTRNDNGELVISLSEADLSIRVHPLLAPYFKLGAWARAQREMLEASERLIADGFQPDGIRVECGPTWSQRQSLSPRADQGLSSRGS